MLKYNIQDYCNANYMAHKDAMGGFQHLVKRSFDIVFSLLCLIAFSPLILLFSLILSFSDGPVIFRQERIGYKGRPFTIYNGYTDTMEKMLKRLEYDLEYLDRRTVFTDLGIMLRTFLSVFSGKKF